MIVPLSRRLEYLSLAVSNAKSQYPTANNHYDNVQFLASLEEKLEVAQVQVEIYRVIQEDPDIRDEERDEQLSRLDERLYNVTEVSTAVCRCLPLPGHLLALRAGKLTAGVFFCSCSTTLRVLTTCQKSYSSSCMSQSIGTPRS